MLPPWAIESRYDHPKRAHLAIENGPTYRFTPHRINPLPVPYAVESDRIRPPTQEYEHGA
jgi:hypothetical protein